MRSLQYSGMHEVRMTLEMCNVFYHKPFNLLILTILLKPKTDPRSDSNPRIQISVFFGFCQQHLNTSLWQTC